MTGRRSSRILSGGGGGGGGGGGLLKFQVQGAKSLLQQHNASFAEADAMILELVRERSVISLKEGEPLGCHADDCRVWLSR